MLMCRICLAKDRRLYTILHSQLQDVYQSLTGLPLAAGDAKPLHVCYICHARLQSCHRLKMDCLHSNEWLTQMMSNNKLKPETFQSKLNMRLTLHSAIKLSNVPLIQIKEIKKESIEKLSVQVEVKREPVEGPFTDETSADVDYESFNDNANTFKYQQNDGKNIFADESAYVTDRSYRNTQSHHGEVKIKLHKSSPRSNRSIEKRHNEAHNDGIVYPCDVCDKCFYHKVTFMKHLYTHKDKKYKCDVCKKLVANKLLLKHHICTGTTANKAYQCDICERTFSMKINLITHIRVHTGEKPYECDICTKSFSLEKNLKRHLLVHSGQKPYKCDVCHKAFSVKFNLTSHLCHIHTGQKSFYKCKACSESFTERLALLSHNANVHDVSNKCDFCNNSFNNRTHLEEHIRIHTGERPYNCNKCNKCFVSKSRLTRHDLTHTSERPYQCDICDKKFSRKSDLKIHGRVHTGEKPYQCDICSKQFRFSSNLNKHLHTHY